MPYSNDLRLRVLAAVDGGVPVRQVVALLRVSVSYIFFFEPQAEAIERAPQTTEADRHAALARQPITQFRERRVGLRTQARQQRLLMARELAGRASARHPRRRLTRPPATDESLVDRVPAAPPTSSLQDPHVLAFLLILFGVNLLLGLGSISMAGVEQAIARQAHIGGFLAGLLAFAAFDLIPISTGGGPNEGMDAPPPSDQS